MLVNLRDIAAIAEQGNMAVGAFNAPSLEAVRAAIDAAEELRLPAMITHAECHEDLMPLDVIGPVIVALAKRSTAPICVHLDHGEHLSYIRRALEMGFTGAMFDGSALPYERNVALSRQAARMCSGFDCGLECELGCMGKRDMGAGHEIEDDGSLAPLRTDPDQAADFVERTGTDLLAVCFGTSHGIYRGDPHLSFDVLEKIRARTTAPLVMHGGSGVSDEDYHRSIDAGIRKVNYFTYGAKYAGERVRRTIADLTSSNAETIVYWNDMTAAAHDELLRDFKHVMRVFANGADNIA